MKPRYKQNLYFYIKITLKYLLNACKTKGLQNILLIIQWVSVQQSWLLTLLPPLKIEIHTKQEIYTRSKFENLGFRMRKSMKSSSLSLVPQFCVGGKRPLA